LWLHSDSGTDESAPTRSMRNPDFLCGMYAPLLWQGQALGVLCMDGRVRPGALTEDDLRLMLAVAQSVAPVVVSHQLQRELDRTRQPRHPLLRHFSPKIAQRILAHRGRMRLGGTRGEVTILCTDIRGFTRIARNMEPDDVVDLLNVCFSKLIPVLFAQDGTLDKYVGDAMLAVFGSPDPDAAPYHKAVRAPAPVQEAVRAGNVQRAAPHEGPRGMGIRRHRARGVHRLT